MPASVKGILSAIGAAGNAPAGLGVPERISKSVLERGLDANTAFEIVSIDIAEVDIGQHIGARLRTDQAAADTRVAQARAESRRAAAIALQQEMKAKVAASWAMLLLAEAEIPAAMAVAFRKGQFDSNPSPISQGAERQPSPLSVSHSVATTFPLVVSPDYSNIDNWETEGGALAVGRWNDCPIRDSRQGTAASCLIVSRGNNE